jgi:hypothetical protein
MSLFGILGGKDRHPLHSPEAAAGLIELLPADDPLKALGDLTQWLVSVAQADDFKASTRIEVVGLLDDAAREPERQLMLRYFKDPRLRNATGRILWGAVAEFWAALADALQRCARDDLPDHPVGEAGRAACAGVAARAIRARVTQMRIAMLHYEPVPAAVWAGLYDVLGRCERAGVMAAPTHAYASEKWHTTPQLELLIGLLVAISGPERLPPEEIDAAFRIAQRFAGAARLEPAPFEGATHVFDPARPAPPQRIVPGAKLPAGVRYLGAREAVQKLERMLSHHELDMLDEDVRLAQEYSPGQKITVLRQFMAYWGDHPPQPERKLIRLEGEMSVAHGFHTVCQTIPHVVTRAEREGAKGKPGSSLEVADDEVQEMPETWPERDAGLHVVHAQAGPNVGVWAEVGDLTAIRIHDRGDWWLAAIRRLALGPQGSLQAEFEVLSRKPFGAWMRVMGRKDTSAANWQASGSFAFDYIQGILLTDRPEPGHAGSIIVPKASFVPQQILELLHGERSRLMRFTEFREQGKDYDWCAFEWVKGPG